MFPLEITKSQVISPGFKNAAKDLRLEVRDRAVLSVALSVGSVTDAVTVNALMAPLAPPMMMRVGGIVAGVGGGGGGGAFLPGLAMDRG